MSRARSLADLISGDAVVEASEIADGIISGPKLTSDISFQTSGTISFGDAGENISGDGTNLNIVSSNALGFDVANGITLDSGSGGTILRAGGSTTYGTLTSNSGDLSINQTTSNKDIVFTGNDGGSTITPLKLDMSAGGLVTTDVAGSTVAKWQRDSSTNGELTLSFPSTKATFTASNDLVFVAGGNDICLNNNTTITGNLKLPDNGTIGSATTPGAITIEANGQFTLSGNAQIPNSLFRGTDGNVTFFGANNDVRLTHVHDVGLLLTNETTQAPRLQFQDAGEYISGDGTNLNIVSSGYTNLSSTGNLLLNTSSSGSIFFREGDVNYLLTRKTGDNAIIKSSISDGDLIFSGNDGGSNVDALTLDMSTGGIATFSNAIVTGDTCIQSGNKNVLCAGTSNVEVKGSSNGIRFRVSNGGVEGFGAGSEGGAGHGVITLRGQQVLVGGNSSKGFALGRAVGFGDVPSGQDDLTLKGDVTVTGDFTVNGTTTTLNTATLDIEDKTLCIAKGAADAAAANGAGIIVDGASACLCYTSGTDSWDFNKNVIVSSNKLGIGTSSPTQKLTIGGGNTAKIQFTDGGVQSLYFGDSSYSFAGYFHYDHPSDQFRMNTSGNIVLTGGNVGIGTVSPTSDLDVYGASTPKITVRSGNGTSASIKLQRVAENDTSTDFEIKNDGGELKIIGDNTSQNEYQTLKITTTTHSFFTNNAERMRLNDNGLGIGETNPDVPLHITSNTPIISFDESDASKEYRIGSYGGSFAIHDNTANAFRMVVTSGGKIGIGTTSPDKLLHLDNGNTTSLVIEKDDGGSASVRFYNAGTSTSYIQLDASEDMVYYGGSGVNQIFYAHGSEKGRFTSDGLGIGETTPLGKLHVKTGESSSSVHSSANELIVEGSANTGISILSGNSNEGAIYFGDDGNNDVGRIRYLHNTNQMDFTTNAGIRASITSAGNFGIGTTSPSRKLHVVGAAGTAQLQSTGTASALYFADTGSSTIDNQGIHSKGNSIFISAGGFQKFTVDSNGLVRIGNTSHTNSLISGNHNLAIGNESSGAHGLAILSPTNENGYVSFFDSGNSGSFRGTINYNHGDDSLRTYVNGSEQCRITSTGKILIGTTSENQDFGSGRKSISIKGSGSGDYSNIQLASYGTSGNDQYHGFINFYDGSTSVSRVGSQRESSTSNAYLTFWTSSGGGIAERMRINSSGDILLNTTDTDPTGNNTKGFVFLKDNEAKFSEDGLVLDLNRKGSNGGIQHFRKDGTVVGVVGTHNWGVGTAPASGAANSSYKQIQIQGSTIADSGGSNSSFQLLQNAYVGTGNNNYAITGSGSSHTNRIMMTGGVISFSRAYPTTTDNQITYSESMRIANNGQVIIGATSAGSLTNGKLIITHDGNTTYGIRLNSTNTSGTQYHLSFDRGQTQAGYITSNSATTIAFNNASDERLKENIQNSGSAIKDIKDLKVRQFDWKDNIDTHRDFGFVAQELINIVPEAVTKGSDELNENGKPVKSWGVDYSHLVPRLVKAVQEQQTKIEELEVKIKNLESE